MIEVIKDKEQWNALLNEVEQYDFYHTYDYHQLSKEDDELPILIKYTDGHTTVVLPFLLRNIVNTNYKDLTCVYGYVGALTLRLHANFKVHDFHSALYSFFRAHNIISVFSRLHPFIENNATVLDGLGEITSLGKVVYIDLSKSIADQRADYNRRLKTYLNKSRKLCTVIEGHTKAHFDTFIQLYLDNMTRIGADESYHFDTEYYYKLLSSKDYDSKLMLCQFNETQEIIAGAIFIKTGTIVQYHLSGLNDAYFKLQPIKLIIDEMSLLTTNEKFKYLNLGGGKGSKEDSLFRFKSKFSKNFKEFKIWKYIVNKEVYKSLAEHHLKSELKDNELYAGYFPAYRSSIKSIAYILSVFELCMFPI